MTGLKAGRALVTGAGGFIGSHLCQALAEREVEVRAFVRYTSRSSAGHLDELPASARERIEVVAGDLRDHQAVRQACDGVTEVFHLGALVAIPYSYVHPVEVVETNVIGTLNVLLAAAECGARRVIQTSTSEVYGTAQVVPIPETHPLHAQSPYAASKIGADKLAESFHCAHGLPVVIVRPFNTYGPRQSARAIIPTIVTQALACDTIVVGDLAPKRDFTYVDDTVAGFIAAATAENVVGRTLNLGAGEDISIDDLVQRILALVGRRIAVEVDPTRIRPERSEVMRLRSDNREARRLLGWEPRVPLDAGLKKTIEWIAAHIAHYQPGRYQV